MSAAANNLPFAVTGVIDASNFESWQQRGEQYVAQCPADQVPLDLVGLERSNSLVVALLLAWLRCADSHGKALQIAQVPQSLRYIIEFSGLSEVLSL